MAKTADFLVAMDTRWTEQAMASLSDAIRFSESAILQPYISSAYEAIQGIDRAIAQVRGIDDLYRASLPDSVRQLEDEDIDKIALINQTEGIPLGWVPRPSIIEALLSLPDSPARLAYLSSEQSKIIDDCTGLQGDGTLRWMSESLEATRALEAGYPLAAQSLAANIVDTIVLELGGGRAAARQEALRSIEEVPIVAVGQALTIKPLYHALTPWYANTGAPVPLSFSRHATAHAVGHPGVCTPITSLISVMLAVSLARQFG